MRVTHVITRLIIGGAQENTVDSVLGLRQKPDLTVDLISGPTQGPEGSLENRFAPIPNALTIVPSLVRPVCPWRDGRALLELTRIFRRTRPDLVHTHSGKAGVLGRLAAWRAGVPLIVHTIHGPSFGLFQGPLANTLFRMAERAAARVTTHFVSVADAMTRQYLAAGIGQPRQFTRIYSGFPLEPFLAAKNLAQARVRFGLAADDFIVGKIARLAELKGHDDLFVAASELIRRCPKIKFVLIGDGPWRERLVRRARSMPGGDRFVFVGLVSPDKIPEWIGVMDAVVHLSRREGLPRALTQALAAAKPVVAYDCDGAGEVCRTDQTGFLIQPGDHRGLIERLCQLASDAALRERLGRNGQVFVRERFSTERMVEDLHRLYLRLASERGTCQ